MCLTMTNNVLRWGVPVRYHAYGDMPPPPMSWHLQLVAAGAHTRGGQEVVLVHVRTPMNGAEHAHHVSAEMAAQEGQQL